MIIGVIAVCKCDGCGKIKSLHTDQDLQDFAKWVSGKTHDFCPDCTFTNRQINPNYQQQADLATEKIVKMVQARIKGVTNARAA